MASPALAEAPPIESDEEFEEPVRSEAPTEPEAVEPDAPEEPDPLLIDIGGQLSMIPGGKKATGSSLRLVGGKFTIQGELKKGQKARVTLLVEVGEVAFVDERDGATGQVIACERRHKSRPLKVESFEAL